MNKYIVFLIIRYSVFIHSFCRADWLIDRSGTLVKLDH